MRPFHLAFPVHDLSAARYFYGSIMALPEGRSSDSWIDFDLFGHQIVTHLSPGMNRIAQFSPVDGHNVPVPHFGVVLEPSQFNALAMKLKMAKVRFITEPYVRFEGQPGEQATMFFLDPSGNALEFKALSDLSMLFATQ